MAKPKKPNPYARSATDPLDKWASVEKWGGKWGKGPVKASAQKPSEPLAPERRVGTLPGKYVKGVGALKRAPRYTGDKMLGIAVMHKSCLQPVFTEEQAKDSATMRRS